jgi:hypothetical protein
MAAKRALRSPEGEAERLYEQEQKNIAAEKARQEQEEAAKKQASRARLAAKMAAFSPSP